MITLKKLLSIAAIMLTTTALAQSNYAPPRTASGKPNLQGFWTNASLTTMQRSDNYKDIGLVIPADRLQELTTNHHQNVRQATDDNQVAGQLPDGKDLGRGRGYNAFWVDPGSKFGVVRGEVRTSWITYPENGRIPFSEQGLQLRRAGFSGLKTAVYLSPNKACSCAGQVLVAAGVMMDPRAGRWVSAA